MTPPVSPPHAGLNAAVAAELRAEAGRQKISVPALAELAEIPYGSLRRYLNAERNIDVSVLQQLADALRISASDLVAQAERTRRAAAVLTGSFGQNVGYEESLAAHDSAGSIEAEQEAPDSP